MGEPSLGRKVRYLALSAPQNKHYLLPHLLPPTQLSSWMGYTRWLRLFLLRVPAETSSGGAVWSVQGLLLPSSPTRKTTGGDVPPFLTQTLGPQAHNPSDSDRMWTNSQCVTYKLPKRASQLLTIAIQKNLSP